MVQAGYEYDDATFEKIFRRIYSTFGSSAPYSVFPDAQQFLRWLRNNGCTVGIVSNAEYRYKDVVLPALGLNEVNSANFSADFISWLIEPQNSQLLRQIGGMAFAVLVFVFSCMCALSWCRGREYT